MAEHLTLEDYAERILKPSVEAYLYHNQSQIMLDAYGPLWFWLPYFQEILAWPND